MRFITASNKISIYVSPKCGSRTVAAITALTYDPELLAKHPDWFNERAVIARGNHKHIVRFLDRHRPAKDFYDIEDITTGIRVAVKRDPLKRFISGYTNRVLHHVDIPYRQRPSFSEFIEGFDYFFNHPKDYEGQLAKHFHPQRNTLGRWPSLYTHVIDTSDLEQLFLLVEDVHRVQLPRLRLQQGGNEHQAGLEVKPEHVQFIKQRYIEDYSIWFPQLLSQLP